MFCENCGHKIQSGHKFCTKCGSVVRSGSTTQASMAAVNPSPHKWWYRLFKVVYIFLYLQVLWIVPVVWSANNYSYVGYYQGRSQYKDTLDEAFWYSLLTLVIFVIVLRLIKLTVIYVALGRKPEWGKEFKRLF